MLPWLLLLLPFPVIADYEKPHGVSPSLVSRYVPVTKGSSTVWECLDGSRTIKWSAVNDDYCDCPDGSDEPGTGACPDTLFYCENIGHIASHIPSSRVRDGLCEPECCDGSDELPGVCNNVCKEVGEAYRENEAAERKLRKTGSKIRASYISFAQKEKNRLQDTIVASEREIAFKEKEVARLKDIADRTESLSAATLEHKKQSPLYLSLIIHSRALKSLQREHKKHLEREKALGEILDSLRSGYNPNYQDMAVLEAVRGWEYHAGLPHINDVVKDDESTEEEGSDEVNAEQKEELEEGMWTPEQLEHQLDGLLTTEYEALLLEHDKHNGSPTSPALLYDLTAYIPDAILPQYEAVRDTVFSWLQTVGLARAATPDTSADTSRARQAFHDAERSLDLAKKEKQKNQEELDRLFDLEWFGAEGEWKKLDHTCLEKNIGDYIYEVCWFDEARQKPTKGGSTHSLGRFAAWNDAPGVQPGSPEYYSKQHYTRGTKCWNGPMRSVDLVLSCGIENALLSVVELEKCEYQFMVTTPALCLPPDNPTGKKEEL
ncbi:Glucosidase 2 subunit beta [Grifola frondosa]|uniref:Glucosidase 2 subunit beta n=1 Tax=Grifola frondosa TaxID=5627 RepID=A0A1C7LPQ6_GRIFR|nr:Glucosidase 2 subunit beta [Grifola frondosa]